MLVFVAADQKLPIDSQDNDYKFWFAYLLHTKILSESWRGLESDFRTVLPINSNT